MSQDAHNNAQKDQRHPRTEDDPKSEQAGSHISEPARVGTTKWQVAQSVAAAMIGVQSSKNRKRDFQTGKPLHFIIGGLIGTLLFIFVVLGLVQYVLRTS